MEENKSGEITLDVPILSLITVESCLFSTETADFYKGFESHDRSALSIWIIKGRFSVAQSEIFLSRIRAIESQQLTSCPLKGFGVDSEGRGFVLFPPLEGEPILSTNIDRLDYREAERRFIPCVQILAKLHAADIFLGDLCRSSFLMDRDGRVIFIGVIGKFEVERLPTVNLPKPNSSKLEENIFFVAPELRDSPNEGSADSATAAVDVFALGVLGYRLFSGKYPSIEKESEPAAYKPLSITEGVIQPWCDEVFSTCLQADPDARFQDATEIVETIISSRDELAEQHVPLARVKAKSEKKTERKSALDANRFDLRDKRDDGEFKPRKKGFNFKSTRLWIPALLVFAAGVLFLVIKHFIDSPRQQVISQVVENEKKPLILENKNENLELTGTAVQDDTKDLIALKAAVTDPNLKAAINVFIDSNSSIDQRFAALQDLNISDDSLAYEVLVNLATYSQEQKFRKSTLDAISSRLKRLGASRSAAQLESWLASLPQGEIPEGYEAMLRSVNPQQSVSTRESLLRQIYPSNMNYSMRFAVASALDSDDSSLFQTVIAQLFGDSLALADAEKRSVYALMLASPQISEIFGEDILDRKSKIPVEDLTWVLALLAERNDPRLSEFAEMTVERGNISAVSRHILNILKEQPELTPELAVALVKAALENKTTSDDIALFGAWTDNSAEKVLLSLCLKLEESKLVSEAFETLAAKSLNLVPAASLVQLIHNKYWEQRVDLAPLVAVASLPDVVSEEEVRVLLKKLAPFAEDEKLMELFSSSENPVFLKAIVENYSANMGLGALLKMLNSSDSQTRIRAILALKRFNQIGALKLILARYEKETDLEVLKAYRESFWMIAEREAKKEKALQSQ